MKYPARHLPWLLLVYFLALSAQAGDPASFDWPGGKQAAVSLAYDDALESQLDHAIPALDRHGLKGSFYLPLSSPAVNQRMGEWRAAAANGHELGNHSLFHQCSGSVAGREWVQPQRDLDKTSAAQMQDQVQLANVMLTALDGKHERSMTVPCGDTLAAGQNYIELVKPNFVAIKLGSGAVIADMRRLDLHAVPVAVPENMSGQQLIALVEEAARRGTMVNFTFHGIGGDYLSVSTEAHDELLAYLAKHQDRYWTDTFLNLMKYVRQQQAQAP